MRRLVRSARDLHGRLPATVRLIAAGLLLCLLALVMWQGLWTWHYHRGDYECYRLNILYFDLAESTCALEMRWHRNWSYISLAVFSAAPS